MKILVTGGAGFIGSHLVERLLGRGDTVIVLDNLNDYYDPAIKKSNIADALNNENYTFIEGDIRATAPDSSVSDLFTQNKFDVVVHLSARAGVRPSLEDPLLYEDVNCKGTLNLLEMCRAHDIKRFVFASSSSVYGDGSAPPFQEDAALQPLSPYGATKAAGEIFCRNYHQLYDISTTALRFFTVYGPRQRPDMAIHKFTKLIDNGEAIPFFGDGESERDYTFYSDIIDGITAAIDRDLGFETINLGESQTIKLCDLVKLIGDNLGKEVLLDRQPLQPGDMLATCADVRKAKRLLDYKPTTPVTEGVKKFVEWYRGRGR
jgi:UDP-glucuronate 4-epimerase